MIKTSLLKIVDRWFGAGFAQLLPPPSAPFPNAQPEAILLIRPGGIGDAVHLVPAIQTLNQAFPQSAIDILAERRNAGAFALCPGIRRVYLYDRPGQLLQVLRNCYDVVIDTEQWHRLSAVVARLIRAPAKVGYATNERARMFTHAVPYNHIDYEVTSFLRLLEPLDTTETAPPTGGWLEVPAAARQAVQTLVAADDQSPLVVLFPGASIAERRWGGERFRAVAQACLECDLQVAVIGGEGEYQEAEQIAAGLPLINLAGQTSLAETAAVLERAAVVVSGDSGILHIAVGLDRPTVSLFGSGIAAKWAPRGPQHVVLNKGLPCSPCTRFGYTPPCPYGTRCLKEISVDEVTQAIETLIGKRES
ncbi:MAG: glycosyltransferase family 9 protein [Methylococcaceae bacterium]|nr:glycosyltransferase family 9 protein [Methylococcaceae bacterium]